MISPVDCCSLCSCCCFYPACRWKECLWTGSDGRTDGQHHSLVPFPLPYNILMLCTHITKGNSLLLLLFHLQNWLHLKFHRPLDENAQLHLDHTKVLQIYVCCYRIGRTKTYLMLHMNKTTGMINEDCSSVIRIIGQCFSKPFHQSSSLRVGVLIYRYAINRL